ncbi:hypothetical protein M0805_000690 [Coniferiporia weirii]|nr:hypothetical protein M0805_000690 [Coniferiporia weirii]
MNGILVSLFSCCSRRKPIDATLDERAFLIPPSEDGPSIPAYDAASVDHQKAKERLHGIVKAKEGKMVRVLSRVPFNLRNAPTDGHANTSSSRSNRSPSTNLAYPHNRSLDYMHRQDTSRRSSSKHSPSVSRSESMSSMQQVSVSRFSTTDDPTDPYVEHKLKVHLIPVVKSNQRAFSRRGRSKTRHSRHVEDADDLENAPALEGIQSIDSGRGDVDMPDNVAPGINGGSDFPSGSTGPGEPKMKSLGDEENADLKTFSNELASILKDDFQDVGTLTRSWGD